MLTKTNCLKLLNNFHDLVMIKKETPDLLSEYFLYEDPIIFVLHGEDISLSRNYEIHQILYNEKHIPNNIEQWNFTIISSNPEKARLGGSIYWEASDRSKTEKIKCVVGEELIIERDPIDEKLKFSSYTNTFHHFLPDSSKLYF